MTHAESISKDQSETTKATRAFLMPFARTLDEFVDYLERLPSDVRSESLDDNGMELWVDRPGWMDLVDFENKRRDEKIVPLPFDATPADLSMALRESGWSIALMALLAIDDAVIHPREIEGLISLAIEGLAESIKEHTDRRRGRERSIEGMA